MVRPSALVLVRGTGKHIERTQQVIYPPWSQSLRRWLAGFSVFKQLLLFFLPRVGGEKKIFATRSQRGFVWARGKQNIPRPNNPAVLIHPTPYSICPLKHAFSLGWFLFKATQWDLCQWGSLTSFHNSGSPLGGKDGLLDHDTWGANRPDRIGWKKRWGGCWVKKVLRPGHSHLLLWWWASKPEGSLLGPSFRWPSYIWASYFTRTDSQQGPLGHSRGCYSASLRGFQPLRGAVKLLLFLRRKCG